MSRAVVWEVDLQPPFLPPVNGLSRRSASASEVVCNGWMDGRLLDLMNRFMISPTTTLCT